MTYTSGMTTHRASMKISRQIQDKSQSDPDQSMALSEGPGMGRTKGACLSTSRPTFSSNGCSILAEGKVQGLITLKEIYNIK